MKNEDKMPAVLSNTVRSLDVQNMTGNHFWQQDSGTMSDNLDSGSPDDTTSPTSSPSPDSCPSLYQRFYGCYTEHQNLQETSQHQTIEAHRRVPWRVRGMVRQRSIKNEREKLRMQKLTKTMQWLRQHLPPRLAAPNQSLSKIQTLRLSIRYIHELTGLLQVPQPQEQTARVFDPRLVHNGPAVAGHPLSRPFSMENGPSWVLDTMTQQPAPVNPIARRNENCGYEMPAMGKKCLISSCRLLESQNYALEEMVL
uniref:mesogenin-1-like n=1 Tax=Myxine glutinosa TaxID=7769 RepID=UPI00358E0821